MDAVDSRAIVHTLACGYRSCMDCPYPANMCSYYRRQFAPQSWKDFSEIFQKALDNKTNYKYNSK